MQTAAIPVFLLVLGAVALCVVLLLLGNWLSPRRPSRVKRMPYESGMDPIHDTRRRFDIRYHLLAIAFLLFDVELLFLYPWAVASRPAALDAAAPPSTVGIDAAVASGAIESRGLVFAGVITFVALLTLGFVYDWRKGVFRWH